MTEQAFNAVFSKRLRHYLELNNITQKELADKLSVGTTSVYNWCNGLKTPRMDKVDAMCRIFNCNRSDLIEDKKDPEEPAQSIFERQLVAAFRKSDEGIRLSICKLLDIEYPSENI